MKELKDDIEEVRKKLNELLVESVTNAIVEAAANNFREKISQEVRVEVEKYTVERLSLFYDHIFMQQAMSVSIAFADEVKARITRLESNG